MVGAVVLSLFAVRWNRNRMIRNACDRYDFWKSLGVRHAFIVVSPWDARVVDSCEPFAAIERIKTVSGKGVVKYRPFTGAFTYYFFSSSVFGN